MQDARSVLDYTGFSVGFFSLIWDTIARLRWRQLIRHELVDDLMSVIGSICIYVPLDQCSLCVTMTVTLTLGLLVCSFPTGSGLVGPNLELDNSNLELAQWLTASGQQPQQQRDLSICLAAKSAWEIGVYSKCKCRLASAGNWELFFLFNYIQTYTIYKVVIIWLLVLCWVFVVSCTWDFTIHISIWEYFMILIMLGESRKLKWIKFSKKIYFYYPIFVKDCCVIDLRLYTLHYLYSNI